MLIHTQMIQRNKTIVEPMQKLKIASFRKGNNSENTKNERTHTHTQQQQ